MPFVHVVRLILQYCSVFLGGTFREARTRSFGPMFREAARPGFNPSRLGDSGTGADSLDIADRDRAGRLGSVGLKSRAQIRPCATSNDAGLYAVSNFQLGKGV